MIIVSQDKDSIINFDNIDNIDITANSTIIGEEEPYTINYETSTRRQGLGIYQTEERAKEVLQEIVEKYSALPHSSVVICFPSAFAGKRFTVFKSIYFDKATQLQFNGVNMPCPENYHSLLKYMYGDDYMTPIKTKPNYVTAYLVKPDL